MSNEIIVEVPSTIVETTTPKDVYTFTFSETELEQSLLNGGKVTNVHTFNDSVMNSPLLSQLPVARKLDHDDMEYEFETAYRKLESDADLALTASDNHEKWLSPYAIANRAIFARYQIIMFETNFLLLLILFLLGSPVICL